MSSGPRLVKDTPVKPPSNDGAEPRLDWANRLMGEVHGHLLQCALYHVRSQDVAEELAQGILAKLWIDHGEDMRWYDEERLKAYLGTVVRRRHVDFRRRTQTRQVYEAEYQNDIEHQLGGWHRTPEQEQADRELRERIDQAVSALPPGLQDPYRLYLSGLTHKEIAERLNVTAGHTANAVSHATARVREKLADWAPPSYTPKADDAPRRSGRPRLKSFRKRDDA